MKLLEEFLIRDEIYQKDIKDLKMIEKTIEGLPICENSRLIINDYIALMETANERKCEVAFRIGKLLGKLNKTYDI